MMQLYIVSFSHQHGLHRRMQEMRIGIPKETKNNENRVAMTPAGVVSLNIINMRFLSKLELDLGQALQMKTILLQVQKLYPLQKKHGIKKWS